MEGEEKLSFEKNISRKDIEEPDEGSKNVTESITEEEEMGRYGEEERLFDKEVCSFLQESFKKYSKTRSPKEIKEAYEFEKELYLTPRIAEIAESCEEDIETVRKRELKRFNKLLFGSEDNPYEKKEK